METHRFYLEAAMEEAHHAYVKKTYPVGALIVGPDGKIISRGHNHVYSKGNGDFTAHAEVEAIREAGPLLMQKGNFENCRLYTTWEPCLMCCGAILLARIKHVIWVMDDDLHGGLRRLYKNKHLLDSLYYEQKLVDLEISSANEQDLVERMEAWMKDWDGEKETVLSHWRQKDKSIQASLV
jgi:tRNA(adenine34) deaminase